MRQYGDVHRSEAWFEARTPNWAYDPQSWWYKSTGRAGAEQPLWMRRAWHLPELDCPPGRDRHDATLDERAKRGERPLWAERMNLRGPAQGGQAATVYGHRREYKPTEKTEARSMVSAAWAGGGGGGSAGWVHSCRRRRPPLTPRAALAQRTTRAPTRARPSHSHSPPHAPARSTSATSPPLSAR